MDPKAREAAKIAARKSGLTVGAWLNQMIRQSASDQLRRGGAQPADHGGDQPRRNPEDEQREQYYSRAESWDSPSQHPGYAANPSQPGSAPPPAPTIQAVFESIQRLSSRIEQAEQRTAETIAPIAEKVTELSKQIEESKSQGGSSTAPVERAVQKIADRLEKIEGGKNPDGLAAPRSIREPRRAERKGFLGLFRKD